MPDGLMFMVPTKILPTVLSPLFSLGTKIRMAREWFHPPHKANGDETVASLVERHYGPEMVDRLADPLLSGVYGGEATQLSVRAVLPALPRWKPSTAAWAAPCWPPAQQTETKRRAPRRSSPR